MLQDGLKLFVTIYAILATSGQFTTEALINLSASALSAIWSVVCIFIGVAGFVADQKHRLNRERELMEETMEQQLY